MKILMMPHKFLFFSLVFFLISILLFSPILYHFSDFIFQPREIYAGSRTGWGFYFYFSMMFQFLALIFALKTSNKYYILFSYILTFVLAYLHGSKGQLFSIIVLSYLFYLPLWRSIFKKKVITQILFIPFFILIGYSIFALYHSQGTIERPLYDKIITYSDFSRNAMLIVDDEEISLSYGNLLIEDYYISRIPRALWAEKPKDFGLHVLCKDYFIDQFYMDRGCAASGLIGPLFKDFGYLTMIIVIFLGLIRGALMNTLWIKYSSTLSFHYLIPLAYFLHFKLISFGPNNLFLEHYLIGYLLAYLVNQKISDKKYKW